MQELENLPVISQNLLVFNEDFCLYTTALYNLKKKYPENFLQVHEYAANLLELHDGVNDTMNTTP